MNCELLAPAGSMEALRAALASGADAVYIGGDRFGARAYADNPGEADLLRAIDQVHLLGRRLYLTVNTLFKDGELEGELYDWILPFYRQGLDGVIVQDLGVVDFLQKEFPGLPLHASTQMTVTGAHGAEFLHQAGIRRVVPARELSLEEIRTIYDRTGMEIECFVHGAMCYSYSGQCLMSSLSGGRSGNRGRCAGICRLPFRVYEEDRLLTGKHSQYPLNMKDMCTVSYLPDLLANGICSLKIEGRMKKPEYTAGVVSIYRKYLDLCLAHPEMMSREGRDGYHVEEKDLRFLWDLFNRDGFSGGYYYEKNGRDMIALRNEKLEGSRQASAQAVTEKMRDILASPQTELAMQVPVKGKLSLVRNEKAVLILTALDSGISVSTEGAVCQSAQTRPVTEEEVSRQLRKTGGSAFRFDGLDIRMDENLFVPMGQLNSLRREAFRRLEEDMTGRFRRRTESEYTKSSSHTAGDTGKKSGSPDSESEFWAEVETEEQFRYLLDSERLTGFYLPEKLADLRSEARRMGFRVRLALPYILRLADEKRISRLVETWLSEEDGDDGILVRNLEEAGLLRDLQAGCRMIADAGLYTMNSRAEHFLADHGILSNTVSHELNAAELFLRNNSMSEIIVYGRIPVMISAQCLKKTLDVCRHSNSRLMLQDRKGMQFPVFCDCDSCVNRILNAVPLNLLRDKDLSDIRRAGFRSLRFLFTDESGAEARQITDSFDAEKPSTRGHFRRGVE